MMFNKRRRNTAVGHQIAACLYALTCRSPQRGDFSGVARLPQSCRNGRDFQAEESRSIVLPLRNLVGGGLS